MKNTSKLLSILTMLLWLQSPVSAAAKSGQAVSGEKEAMHDAVPCSDLDEPQSKIVLPDDALVVVDEDGEYGRLMVDLKMIVDESGLNEPLSTTIACSAFSSLAESFESVALPLFEEDVQEVELEVVWVTNRDEYGEALGAKFLGSGAIEKDEGIWHLSRLDLADQE